MVHREPERHRQPLRELSARLLEDQLIRLTLANGIIERRLGPGLRLMSRQRLYLRLGFVRLGDYLTERLGMSLRRCQSIVRCERALSRLPEVAAAFDAGQLPPSKMRAIIDVATEETQELWLARARRYPVRELMAAARAARQEHAAGSASETPVWSAEQREAGAQGAPATEEVAGKREEADDPGVNVCIHAPARVAAIWHWALDLVRRAAGHQEPAWRCIEYLAAEFLSGAPRDAALPPAAGGPIPLENNVALRDDLLEPRGAAASPIETGATFRAVPAALIWNEATAAARDALRPLGRAADPDVILARAPAPEIVATEAADPWDLDARLRGLIRLRQSLAWRQGRLLAVISSRHLHAELGAESFSEWCGTTLGMSPRRARYLISLDRRIRRLPQIADAYRRGRISWCQARHLVRIVTSETESRWIRYARQVTVRRLEEAIARAESGTAAGPPLPVPEAANDATAGPPRHTCAPTLAFDDRTACGSDDRPDNDGPDEAPEGSHGRERAGRQIRFWAPTDVAALWSEALAVCRRQAKRPLADWHCLIMMFDSLRQTWESPADRGWKRRYRIFERDGWRCRVPGCTSRANLNEHHIVFQSRGGDDADRNLVTLCVAHHQRGIHGGQIGCTGTAPDDLWWELGVRSSGPPLLRCRGDRIIRDGRPGASRLVRHRAVPVPGLRGDGRST